MIHPPSNPAILPPIPHDRRAGRMHLKQVSLTLIHLQNPHQPAVLVGAKHTVAERTGLLRRRGGRDDSPAAQRTRAHLGRVLDGSVDQCRIGGKGGGAGAGGGWGEGVDYGGQDARVRVEETKDGALERRLEVGGCGGVGGIAVANPPPSRLASPGKGGAPCQFTFLFPSVFQTRIGWPH